MSGPFRSIDTAQSGLSAHSRWLDAIGHNIANVNTRTAEGGEPFRALEPVLRERPNGEGVEIAAISRDGGAVAQIDGGEQLAKVDLAAEMTDMILANRGYQANLRTIEAARERYQAAMRLGR